MNGIVVREIVGYVTTVEATGLGRNGGEVLIAIQALNTAISAEVFVAVMPDNNPELPIGTIPGPYAAYVTLAVAAMTSGRRVRCRYEEHDKFRVSGLQLL